MAILTIKQRKEVVRRILTDSFKPRFDAIEKQATELVKEAIETDHPKFLEMLSDPNLKKYMILTGIREVKVSECRESKGLTLCHPLYGSELFHSMPIQSCVNECRYGVIRCSGVIVPSMMSYCEVINKGLIDEYRRAWSDYTKAITEVVNMLNGYTNRVMFEEDFPGFVKYLPAQVKPRSLPAVISTSIKSNLSALGIKV